MGLTGHGQAYRVHQRLKPGPQTLNRLFARLMGQTLTHQAHRVHRRLGHYWYAARRIFMNLDVSLEACFK